ncbi:MAG: hypothetical protein DRQ60_07280 [Gammaproteobacteria bacterium]|nr:MAG: hypothetical protein DRQ60_07280 [Gammaproteobacteria bacterium]
MYYVTLQPYSGKQVKPLKVDEDKVLFYLRDVVLLAPHKLHVQSQERSGPDHTPAVNDNDELIYSYKKHGFVVPFEVLQHVSRHT